MSDVIGETKVFGQKLHLSRGRILWSEGVGRCKVKVKKSRRVCDFLDCSRRPISINSVLRGSGIRDFRSSRKRFAFPH